MCTNIFNQNPQAGAMPHNMFGAAFAQNNGLNFNNVAPAKTSSSTQEEMAIIKANKKSDFNVSPEELAKYSWDYRDGQTLAIEVIDPNTDKVRAKYTGDEFYLVIQPKEVLDEYLRGINNFAKTTAVMNTTSDPSVLKQVLGAVGVITKLLPMAYEEGKKNYNALTQQMQNMMSNQGYQGNFGGQAMFNGAIGAVPNYIINDGGMMVNQPNQQMAMLQQAAAMGAQAAQQQMAQNFQNMANNGMFMNNGMMGAMGMGAPMPTGGTMMGTGVNPFMQGGVAQQMPTATTTTATTPQLNIPNIPMPGTLNVNATTSTQAATTSTQGTANPGIGTVTAGTVTV